MDFTLTDDQHALADHLRRELADRCDHDTLRMAMELPGAVDRTLWSALATTGVFGLMLAEQAGGIGLGYADATVVFEELGRALVPGPLVGTFLTADVIEGAADGTAVVGLVSAEAPLVVEHLEALDVLVILDRTSVSWVAGRDVVADLVARPLDPLTPVSIVREPVAGTVLDVDLDTIRGAAAVLIGAQQVGLATAAIELATDYARQRHQFGRPIGSFQAIKHILADAHAQVEVARTAVQAAGVLLDSAADTARAAHGARLVASRAAKQAGETCVQVHGGMGFTWELAAHLYLKRSLALDTALGGIDNAAEAVAAAL